MRYRLGIALMLIILAGCDKYDGAEMISSSNKTAESVYLTHDQNDNPVVTWTEKNDETLILFFATSTDDGKTFSNKIGIPLSSNVATHAESMPKVAFKKNGVIIAAYEKKTPTQENKYAGAIYYITSTDKGKSWAQEKFLHRDTIAGKSRSYFDLETLPDGEIGAAWLDIKLTNETGGRSVRFARTNATNDFANEIVIDSSACQCCRLDVYKDVNNFVYVAYRGLKKSGIGKSIRDMMVATSVDHGKHFGIPLPISVDNWNIEGCPHTGPSLCSNKTGLFTLWYTEGNGNGVYYSHRSKTNASFHERKLVSRAGRHPQVCANNNDIAMLWEENTEGDNPLTNVHYRIIEDGIEVESNLLTPGNFNAYVPVITQTKKGFLTAYLMENHKQVGVYVQNLKP